MQGIIAEAVLPYLCQQARSICKFVGLWVSRDVRIGCLKSQACCTCKRQTRGGGQSSGRQSEFVKVNAFTNLLCAIRLCSGAFLARWMGPV